MIELQRRTIAKSITWRITSIVNAFLVLYLLFGNPLTSITASLLGNATGALLYYLHERLWSHSSYGMYTMDKGPY